MKYPSRPPPRGKQSLKTAALSTMWQRVELVDLGDLGVDERVRWFQRSVRLKRSPYLPIMRHTQMAFATVVNLRLMSMREVFWSQITPATLRARLNVEPIVARRELDGELRTVGHLDHDGEVCCLCRQAEAAIGS